MKALKISLIAFVSIINFSTFATDIPLAEVQTIQGRNMKDAITIGYRLAYTNAAVNSTTSIATSRQLSGVEASYGITRDISVGGYFGFGSNFDFAMLGPKVRYDVHRLISRNSHVWDHLHLFVESGMFAKFGSESKFGVTFHLPYAGIEILPFKENNLSIKTAAGLVLDDAMFGDLGISY
jgi:hypothetical protein